jgi:signal transduction histidine kinase
MKKYLYLVLGSFIAVAAMTYIYKHSVSTMLLTHYQVMDLLSDAKQSDVKTVREVLRARGFLSLNFDNLVTGEQEMAGVCGRLTEPNHHLYGVLSRDLDLAISDYCLKIDEKLSFIESFKSKNAIYKNSLYYLHKMTTDKATLQGAAGKRGDPSALRRDLLHGSLTYAAVSTPESRALLEGLIAQADRIPAHQIPSDLFTIRAHAKSILAAKDVLDNLVQKILAPDSTEELDRIRDLYLAQYAQHEKTAGHYRDLLLIGAFVFLAIIIFCVFRLWSLAKALLDANLHLEDRVRARTQELQESRNTIIQQQQTLIATAKLSALGEMAGGVAHEINNPLSIIGMKVEQLAECLDEGEFDRDMFKESLATVTRTTHRIAKIVSGLRFFARDGQREAFQMSTVQSLIDETLGFCREKFANYGIDVDVPENLSSALTVECRGVEISQVLLNLLNNAFDAIQDYDQKWIRVTAEEHSQFIKIAVTDCGPGIAKDIQEKMMQPFFTTKEIGKGTGLGLSISRGIIESHKGKLYVDNNNPNTSFVVLLPKFQGEAIPIEPPTLRAAS